MEKDLKVWKIRTLVNEILSNGPIFILSLYPWACAFDLPFVIHIVLNFLGCLYAGPLTPTRAQSTVGLALSFVFKACAWPGSIILAGLVFALVPTHCFLFC